MKTGKTTFSAEERAALRERAEELQPRGKHADTEQDVLEKIAAMAEPDRVMAQHLHDIIRAHTPQLVPRTWYGMPAYAKDRQVICFFQAAGKFKTRYSTLGFSDKAALDDNDMWPTAFALSKLAPAVEARIRSLLKNAVS